MSRNAVASHDVPALVPLRKSVDLTAWDIPHPRPFVCEITIGPELLSRSIPHVSNIEYVRWLDRAAELHSDAVGFTRAAMFDQNVMWFVARHEIDYLAETWLNDQLLIVTWVRNFSRVKSWRDYAIIRPGDARVICRAATLWVLVDLETRRPTRIPSAMRNAFEAIEGIKTS